MPAVRVENDTTAPTSMQGDPREGAQGAGRGEGAGSSVAGASGWGLGWVGWIWVIEGRIDAFSFPEKLGSVMVVSGKHPPPPAVDDDDLR